MNAREGAAPHELDDSSSEDGSALVEFLALALLLLIPVVYLILTLTQLHAGQFAASSAAQSAMRVFIAAPDSDTAHERAAAAVRIALDDQGFTDVSIPQALSIECSNGCSNPSSRIHISVAIPVHVPGIPFLDTGPAVMTASDEQHASLEQFRSEE